MENFERILSEINRDELKNTVVWLTENTPYRLAGSEDEAKAAEYVCNRMREYGLEVKNDTFSTYNSDPQYSKLEILSPERREIKSLPCAHIKATSMEGEDFELVYGGNGDYKAYENLDVRGKMVLVEVSYAPPVPEKARIAFDCGAAGIICMNWGNDEDVICHRGLKGVWGNPTRDTMEKIPDLIGIGVTHNDGLYLKDLCQKGPVHIHVTAIADRKWTTVHQPTGFLKGNGKSDQFLLICSHLDAWQPGVTCNATGNATALEICRILSKHREELDRNIIFAFWDGHEIAEAAGSTWFVDNYWDLLQKNCVIYMHIDSTGVDQTEIYEIKASEELLGAAIDNLKTVVPGDLRAMSLKKIGDQSFMGIGVASVTQRMSFTKEAMEYAHGATLGWWNHTCEDGLDKCNFETLFTDTKVHLSLILKIANEPLLPYDFTEKLDSFEKKLKALDQEYGDVFPLGSLIENYTEMSGKVKAIQQMKSALSYEKYETYNQFMMSVSRHITNVTMTRADKYQQDSYGHSYLSFPVPLFAELAELRKFEPNSLEYGMLQTSLVKARNRISDAVYNIAVLADLFEQSLRR